MWAELRRQLPSLAAYVVSFLTILMFWVNHHALYHAVARVDRVMLFVNGALLLAISFISYATAAFGRHCRPTAMPIGRHRLRRHPGAGR